MCVPGDTEPVTEERLEVGGWTEEDWSCYSGEEEAKERRHCCLQLPERRLQEGGCQSVFLVN